MLDIYEMYMKENHEQEPDILSLSVTSHNNLTILSHNILTIAQ